MSHFAALKMMKFVSEMCSIQNCSKPRYLGYFGYLSPVLGPPKSLQLPPYSRVHSSMD